MKNWLGRKRQEEDELAVGAVRRLAALLDQEPDAYRRGSEIPESWYAILFGPTARQSLIGPDGHPRTGDDFLPPLHNTRRMFAGRRVAFHKPLKAGDEVTRISTVAKVEPKTGRSGSFTLLTVVHEMSAGAGVAITEEQDIVYREMVANPTASAAAGEKKAEKPAASAPEEPTDWSVVWTPDTVQLFRYSALTFNAHRIHYDLPYAREKEGYPSLVINGGLTALMLVETARPHLAGAIASYDARAMQPLFIGQTVRLNGRLKDGVAELWASGPEGAIHYRVNATVAK